MKTRINLNGKIQEEVFVSALDHGFLFGDSVYEVLCTFKNRPCFLNQHLKRLKNSADGILLSVPWDYRRFEEEIKSTLTAAGNEESYIRIVVTRGIGEIDIDPESCTQPNILIYVKPAKTPSTVDYERGIEIALVTIKRNIKEALNPSIKTGNYLNNVLAKMEANKMGAKDALMLNHLGQLTECTTSNFFWMREGHLRTPDLDCGILSGITRDAVIQLARENGLVVEEGHWGIEELSLIDEAFITGTLKKIMPVTRLNGKPVGDGIPGPVTRKLIQLYGSVLQSHQ